MMMMEFLYFPEDKSEYIPALISLTIFMILAAVTMYLFYKKSKKEEEYINEKYNLNDDVTKEKDDQKSTY